jgi:hypothetical protein
MRMTRWAMDHRAEAGVRSQRKSWGEGGKAVNARQGGIDRRRSARLHVRSGESRSGFFRCRPSGGVALPGEWERA